jgi:hypothetical protein
MLKNGRPKPKPQTADDRRFNRRQQAYRAVAEGRNVEKNMARIERLAPPRRAKEEN